MKMTDTGDTGKIGYFYRSYPCRPCSGTTPFYFPGSISCLFENQGNATIWEQLHRRTHSLCRESLNLSYSPYNVSGYTKIWLYSSTPSSPENISINNEEAMLSSRKYLQINLILRSITSGA